MKIIPNLLSIFRICLVPFFIVVYFSGTHDSKVFPALIYALASFSDFLDGFLARRFNASSKLGMFLDPLGDKLMTISVMVCITIDGIIPFWAVLVAGVKEILMAIGGFVMHKVAHADIMPANMLGKTATVIFFFVCVTLMLFRSIPGDIAIVMISVAIVLTLLALASYLDKYIKLMKNRNKSDQNKVGNN